jgi:hypothetical protein
MAILASGHKLVRCGIDGAISGVVTDETLSGNGTSGKPLGALLEDVIFDDSITESSTDFGTLIGVNPLWVNYVVTGGGSSGGDPQVNYIVNTYSGAWNDTTDVVQSNSAQWAEGGSGDVEVNSFVYDNSATINEVNTTFQNNSGHYLTAHQSLEGYATQDWVTAQGYITGVDLSNYYTKNDTSSKSEINAALTSITPGDAGVNSYVQSNSATINEVNTTVNSNSSKWNAVTGINTTYYQGLDETVVTKINGYNIQAKVDQYGNVINTTYATKSQVNDLSGKVDEISAVAGGNVEVNTYVQSNSATINNVNTTYQTNSGNYLTAHQDISNKLDTNSFTAWSAAQAANAFKLSAGNGINLIDDSINKITRIDVTASEGDVEVNTYVQTNSANINNTISTYQSNSGNYITSLPQSSTWNDVASTYQTASSTYLTAHQDVSNKLDITAFTSWSATQEANDYELSAGNGVTLYDDTVNKITRIDANGSNFLTIYSKNEGQNSAVLGLYHLYDGANAIQGIVQFVPNGTGTFALCPFTAENNNAYYSSLSYQCTNSPTVNSGDLVTLPFHFFADGQYVCPSVLGIKGSNSTATITPYNIIINYK